MSINMHNKLKMKPLLKDLSFSDVFTLSCAREDALHSEEDDDIFNDNFFDTEILPGILEAFGLSPDDNAGLVTTGSLSSVKGTSVPPSGVPLRELKALRIKEKEVSSR